MKNLIQFATVLLLLATTIGYGQTKTTQVTSKEQATNVKKDTSKTKIDTEKFKNFVGKYLLEEGDFILEIVVEKDKMYIISPFSKDILTQKNETTLREAGRGVDLQSIKDNKDALKFSQNGYETIIKRVDDKKGK